MLQILDPLAIKLTIIDPETNDMMTFAPNDVHLERLVSAMTPNRPDFQRLIDALRLVELETGQALNMRVTDTGSRTGLPIFPAISQESKTKTGHAFYQILGIDDFGYINYCQVMNDRYDVRYKSFVAAVFDFAEYVLPSAPKPGSPRRL